MIKSLIPPLLFLTIAGCTTNPDGTVSAGLPTSPAWQMTTSRETKLDFYRHNCLDYGFVSGTPEFASCVQEEATGKTGASHINL